MQYSVHSAEAVYDIGSPYPPVHISWAIVITWRIKGKTIRKTALCHIVYDSCAQWHRPIYYEQFLKMSVGLDLGLSLCVVCLGLGFCVFWFSLDYFILVSFALFCCVRFSFISTTARDWLGNMSRKWHLLCWVGLKTLTQSISDDIERETSGPSVTGFTV